MPSLGSAVPVRWRTQPRARAACARHHRAQEVGGHDTLFGGVALPAWSGTTRVLRPARESQPRADPIAEVEPRGPDLWLAPTEARCAARSLRGLLRGADGTALALGPGTPALDTHAPIPRIAAAGEHVLFATATTVSPPCRSSSRRRLPHFRHRPSRRNRPPQTQPGAPTRRGATPPSQASWQQVGTG